MRQSHGQNSSNGPTVKDYPDSIYLYSRFTLTPTPWKGRADTLKISKVVSLKT